LTGLTGFTGCVKDRLFGSTMMHILYCNHQEHGAGIRVADETFSLPSGQGKNILSILLILSKKQFHQKKFKKVIK
jgi:hypothetical protein